MDRRSFLASAVVLACLGVSGCTGTSTGDPSASSSPAEPSTTASLPPGTWWVDVPGMDAKFATPTTWKQHDPAKLAKMTEPELPQEVREKAASMGMSGVRMISTFAGKAQMMSLDPYTKASLYVRVSEAEKLPEDKFLMKTVTDLGGTPGKPATPKTPIGEIRVIPYQLSFGAAKSAGEVLAVVVDGKLLTITLSAKDEAVVKAESEILTATLSRRDK